jgi:hypothetical protein
LFPLPAHCRCARRPHAEGVEVEGCEIHLVCSCLVFALRVALLPSPASIVHRRAHALGHLGRIASYGCWHRGAWIVRLSGPKLKQ